MSLALRLAPDLAKSVREVEWEPLSATARGGSRASALMTMGTAMPALGAAVPAMGAVAMAASVAEELFGRVVRFLGGVRALTVSTDAFPWPSLDSLLRAAADALESSDELFWVAHRPTLPEGVDYLAIHQARVAIMALRLGRALGWEPAQVENLGRAAALFDVGLWTLPEPVARQADPMAPATLEHYRAHPALSADIVRRWAPPSDDVVAAVRQHHEREQGQGYPDGTHGEAIAPEAKVIGMLDTYAGLTAPPPPRVGRPPHDALREIIRSRNRAFAPDIIKALISETSLFPPGTVVRLSSGETGRVVGLNRNHPLRPRVEIFTRNAHGAARLADLTETPFLYITGPIAA